MEHLGSNLDFLSEFGSLDFLEMAVNVGKYTNRPMEHMGCGILEASLVSLIFPR